MEIDQVSQESAQFRYILAISVALVCTAPTAGGQMTGLEQIQAVFNPFFGGSFSSRLFSNIRFKKEFAYAGGASAKPD